MLQQSFSHKLVSNVINFRWQRIAGQGTAVSIPQAVQIAYKQFQHTHSEWVGNLFDKSFLTTEAAPLFARNTLPTATQLAIAWCNQFGTGMSAKRAADIEKVFPIAKIFLAMVQQAMKA